MSERTPEAELAKHSPVVCPEENRLIARVRAAHTNLGIYQKGGDVMFTQELKDEYVRLLAETGALNKCALAINLTLSTVRKHRKEDKDFGKACEDALDVFRDKIDLAVYHRAVEGWLEAVYFQGIIVGYVRKYSDSMLAMFAKRHNPAYREKFELDANIRTAALVVTAPMGSVEAMQEAAATIRGPINEADTKTDGPTDPPVGP